MQHHSSCYEEKAITSVTVCNCVCMRVWPYW